MIKKMNKKGQGMFLQIIIAIFIWIGGVMAIPLMKDVIDGARTGLSCATPSLITDGTKLLCLVVDTGVILVIWTLVVIIGSLLFGGTK